MDSILEKPQRRPVNWRSVGLGLLGVVFIAALTPYNNDVMNNTELIGNCLPAGLLLFFVVFIALVNAPLHRWARRYALDSRELAVSLAMMLCACSLPAVGLMRYLPGHLVAYFYHAAIHDDYRKLFTQLGLPDWMFPTFTSKGVIDRGNDVVVQGFFNRIPVLRPTFLEHVRAVPWSAWLTPTLTWGILVGAVLGGILCMSLIFRHQWAENEHLPFPLASIYVSLIESPENGRAWNTMFRSRGFWIAFVAVFVIHALSALHQYYPRYVPIVPTSFNLQTLMADAPWTYADPAFKFQHIYFTIVGIMFFVQSDIAFSLWFFFVAMQAAKMILGTSQIEITEGMQTDQIFGAMVPFAIAILWVGRHHLAMVARRMVRRHHGPTHDRYLPYSVAGWGFVVCQAIVVIWLVAAGASVAGAVVLVLMLLLVFLVVGRIVAETGLLYVLIPVALNRPWVILANDLPAAMTARTSVKSFFFSTMFYGLFTHDLRESAAVFVPHALRVADVAAYPEEKTVRRTFPLIMALVLALTVGYFVSGAARLYIHYSYNVTLDKEQLSPIGAWGALDMARYLDLDSSLQYVPPGTGPKEGHNRVGHFAFGAATTTTLSVLRLRFVGWPLHPIGFIMMYSWGMRQIWFSILIGWFLKTMIIRIGGGQLLRQSKNFFLGLIVADAAAIAFWIAVSFVRLGMGLEYHAIRLLPS